MGDHNLSIYLPLNPNSPAHSELSMQDVTIDAAVLKSMLVLLRAVISIVGEYGNDNLRNVKKFSATEMRACTLSKRRK